MGLLLNATRPMLTQGTMAVITKPFYTKSITDTMHYIPEGTVVTIISVNPLLRTYDIKQQDKNTYYTVDESYVKELRAE